MQDDDQAPKVSYFTFKDNTKRAYLSRHQELASPKNPGIIFLGGHGSDMFGSKAEALDRLALEQNIPFLRFDYYGHGLSDGKFLDGNMSRWLEDCLMMVDGQTTGPQILVGSSLGGWLMLRTALLRRERIAGLIGIAAAPDFTQTHIWDSLTPEQQRQMREEGQIALANAYAPGDVIYPYHLITDGREHLLLTGTIDLELPVILHQGMADEEVPWQTAIEICDKLASQHVQLIFDKNAGHRYSEPHQINALLHSTHALITALRGQLASSRIGLK